MSGIVPASGGSNGLSRAGDPHFGSNLSSLMSDFLSTLETRVLLLDGAFGTWVAGPGSRPRGLRRPRARGVQRESRPDPARSRRPDAPRVLRGGGRCGRDRDLRGLCARARGVRAWPTVTYDLNVAASPHRQGCSGRVRHARPAPVRHRLDRPRHAAPVPRCDQVRGAPGRLPAPGRRPHRGRRRRPAHRDRLRHAPGQVGDRRLPPGDERRGPHPPADGPGHDGDHRSHARRLGDRRRRQPRSRQCARTCSA